MYSQPDKEEAAGTVLKASLPFLKSDECERVKGQLSYIVQDMKEELLFLISRRRKWIEEMEKRNVYLFVTLLYTLQLIRESFIPTFKINDATISETIFLDDMLHDKCFTILFIPQKYVDARNQYRGGFQ